MASDVWADTAYRSKAIEDFMEKHGFVSKVYRKKPHLKLMPRHIQRANAQKSVIRAHVEHVFADQNATRLKTEISSKGNQLTVL